MPTQMIALLGAVLALTPAAAGLNFTYTGNCSIGERNGMSANYVDLPYFNATGASNFTMRDVTGNDDPWYYYLKLQDGTLTGARSVITRRLSVPGSFLDSERANRTRICMATSSSYDKKVKNAKGNNTCDGVLSGKCISGLRDKTDWQLPKSCSLGDEDLSDECKLVATAGVGPLTRDRGCFFSNLPGVGVPEGYGVVSLIGLSYGQDKDDEKAALKLYDEAVRGVVATVFTFLEEQGEGSAKSSTMLVSQSVCAAPNVVNRYSRPVDSAAGETRRRLGCSGGDGGVVCRTGAGLLW